jgi:branched-chain amino acid transport system ATP-binding protein
LRGQRDASGTSILIIEQNVKFAMSVADRYAVLKLGEISDRGRADEGGVEAKITDQLSV